MIEIKDLRVNVGEKEILRGISLNFEIGKNYLILGKNGSGKSSLVNFLMGNPFYKHVSGKVFLDGVDLAKLKVDERSKAGLFLSFQNIPEIEGINLAEFLRIIYNNHLKSSNKDVRPLSPFVFKRFLSKYLSELEIDENLLARDLNVGFSGGEKRKIELLQAKLLEPKYIMLDEIDSGLDVNALKVVLNSIKKLDNKNNSIIAITHQFDIIKYVNFDTVYVLKDGALTKRGGMEILKEIKEKGFE